MAVLLLVIPDQVQAGNILVLAFPAYSHIKPLLNVVNSLANTYRHKSTFVMNEQFAKLIKEDSYTSVVVPTLYKDLTVDSTVSPMIKDVCNQGVKVHVLEFRRILINMYDTLLGDEDLISDLQNRNFDLALIDNTIPGFVVLAYKLGIPYVEVGPMYLPVRTRVPFMPSVHPTFNLLGFFNEMTFIQRLANLLVAMLITISPNPLYPSNMVERYVPEKPDVSLDVLHRRAAFHLIDSEFILDFPKPMLPNMEFVGGLSTEKPKPLTQELDLFMDSATTGVIIVSFGSVAKTLPVDRMMKLIGVFKKIQNVKFVLRYGTDTNITGNVLLMPWVPQNDLLGHPKTVAFITHCGNSGLYEGLNNAVPMIGLPLFGDQFFNCRKMASKGFGIAADFCSFTDSELSNIIQDILTNSTYKETIRKASRIFHGQQGTPSERAAFWIDHVMEHGGEYLQSPEVDMPMYKFYLIDVFLCMTFCIFVMIKCCSRLSRYCRKSKVKTD